MIYNQGTIHYESQTVLNVNSVFIKMWNGAYNFFKSKTSFTELCLLAIIFTKTWNVFRIQMM